MVLLTRHEESIKARLWFAFQWSWTTFTTYESLEQPLQPIHLLGLLTENKRGYISCGSVLVEGTSTRLFKKNKGGYIPCGSLLVKEFYKVEKKSQGPQVTWGLDVGTGCCRTSIKPLCVCLLLPYSFNFRCAL